MRSGTLAVPGIVGLGTACVVAQNEMHGEGALLSHLRERLWKGLRQGLGEVLLNGHPTERLPGNLNLSFAQVDGNALLAGLRDVAVSSGAACTSADPEPSYVLRALGVEDDLAQSTLRFGLGRFNTAEEVDHVVSEIVQLVRRLRAENPLNELVADGMSPPG
jgi:cysteine desulfurase